MRAMQLARVLIATLAAVVLVGLVSAPGQASEVPGIDPCFRCNDVEDGMGGWEHYFSESSGAFFECAPNTCHLEELPGICSSAHNDCDVFALKQDESALAALNKLSKEDQIALRHMLDRYLGSELVVNQERQAIQILGCDDTILAHASFARAANVEDE